MYINQQIGKLGEDLACKYLKENKYTIIERKLRPKNKKQSNSLIYFQNLSH